MQSVESLWDDYVAAVKLFHRAPCEIAQHRLIRAWRRWADEFLPKLDQTADVDHLTRACQAEIGRAGNG